MQLATEHNEGRGDMKMPDLLWDIVPLQYTHLQKQLCYSGEFTLEHIYVPALPLRAGLKRGV